MANQQSSTVRDPPRDRTPGPASSSESHGRGSTPVPAWFIATCNYGGYYRPYLPPWATESQGQCDDWTFPTRVQDVPATNEVPNTDPSSSPPSREPADTAPRHSASNALSPQRSPLATMERTSYPDLRWSWGPVGDAPLEYQTRFGSLDSTEVERFASVMRDGRPSETWEQFDRPMAMEPFVDVSPPRPEWPTYRLPSREPGEAGVDEAEMGPASVPVGWPASQDLVGSDLWASSTRYVDPTENDEAERLPVSLPIEWTSSWPLGFDDPSA